MNAFIVIVCGYFIGSIPFAFLLARRDGLPCRGALARDVDLRWR